MNYKKFSDFVEVYQGDCFEILPHLKRFDFLWADPPYNVGKNYQNHNDSMDHKSYMRFIADFLSLATAHSDTMAIYPPKIHLREFWNLLPDHHLLICGFSPAGAVRSNYFHQYVPVLVPRKPLKRIPDHWFNVQLPALGYFFKEKRFDHPGQTSLDLTKRIIQAFTLPGQTIIDPFGGTGTTAIACIDLDRKCTLIEKSPVYFNMSCDRIADHLQQPTLFSEQPNTQYLTTDTPQRSIL